MIMTFFFHLFCCLIPYKKDLVHYKKYSISVSSYNKQVSYLLFQNSRSQACIHLIFFFTLCNEYGRVHYMQQSSRRA